MLLFTAYASTIATKMLTGLMPKAFKDYFYPPTGEIWPDGKPVRLSHPTEVNDIVSMGDDPVRTIENKAAPLLTALSEILRNRDFYGVQVHQPGSKWYDPAARWQDVKHIAAGAMPLALQNYLKTSGEHLSTGMRALAFAGLKEAPKRLSLSAAERTVREKIEQKGLATGTRTPEEYKKAQLKRQLTEALRKDLKGGVSGGPGNKGLVEALRNKEVTPAEVKAMRKDATQSQLALDVEHLDDPRAAMDVFRAAVHEGNQAEMQELRPIILRLMMHAVQSQKLSPIERAGYLKELAAARPAAATQPAKLAG
jgi:uncharacterized protein (DUF2237 family)